MNYRFTYNPTGTELVLTYDWLAIIFAMSFLRSRLGSTSHKVTCVRAVRDNCRMGLVEAKWLVEYIWEYGSLDDHGHVQLNHPMKPKITFIPESTQQIKKTTLGDLLLEQMNNRE